MTTSIKLLALSDASRDDRGRSLDDGRLPRGLSAGRAAALTVSVLLDVFGRNSRKVCADAGDILVSSSQMNCWVVSKANHRRKSSRDLTAMLGVIPIA